MPSGNNSTASRVRSFHQEGIAGFIAPSPERLNGTSLQKVHANADLRRAESAFAVAVA